VIRWSSQPESIASLSAATAATTAITTHIPIENPPSSFYSSALFCEILAECDVSFTIDSKYIISRPYIALVSSSSTSSTLSTISSSSNHHQTPTKHTTGTSRKYWYESRELYRNEPSLNCNRKNHGRSMTEKKMSPLFSEYICSPQWCSVMDSHSLILQQNSTSYEPASSIHYNPCQYQERIGMGLFIDCHGSIIQKTYLWDCGLAAAAYYKIK